MGATETSESAETGSDPVVTDGILETREDIVQRGGLMGLVRNLRSGLKITREFAREGGGLLVESTAGVAGDAWGVLKQGGIAFNEGSEHDFDPSNN